MDSNRILCMQHCLTINKVNSVFAVHVHSTFALSERSVKMYFYHALHMLNTLFHCVGKLCKAVLTTAWSTVPASEQFVHAVNVVFAVHNGVSVLTMHAHCVRARCVKYVFCKILLLG